MEGKMKQAILIGKGGPWEIREVPIPKPGINEVLIKMKTSSICNQTDLNIIRGLHPAHQDQFAGMVPHHLRIWDKRIPDELSDAYPKRPYAKEPYPAYMGHEGMGVVVEVGPCVKEEHGILIGEDINFKPGDRVSFMAGRSSFAEYTLSSTNVTAKVPDSVNDEEASLFEPVLAVYIGVIQDVGLGDTVCILGQGALGLIATQLAKAMGAKKIIVSEPIKFKRDLAKKFGADITIDPSTTNVVHEIEELTDGRGVEVVIEAAGVPETIRIIPYIAGVGAHVGQIGACCVPVLVDWSYIHFKLLQVTAATHYVASRKLRPTFERVFEIMSSGKIDLKSMITHRYYKLEDIEKAFKDVESGMVVKGMFIFE